MLGLLWRKGRGNIWTGLHGGFVVLSQPTVCAGSGRALWEFGLYPAALGRLLVRKRMGLRTPVFRAILHGEKGRVMEFGAREKQLGS